MKFYSDVTKKLYDTQEDLAAAETEAAEAEAKKAEAAKLKKADAKKVEDAFKANNDAKREYNTKVVAARKMYNESIAAAKKVFEEAVADATNAKEAADEAYDKVLKEFIDKHESYHMTLRDGDTVVVLSNQTATAPDVFAKEYNNLLDMLLKIWN